MRIDDATGRLLATALDGLASRQEAIAANLANIDTPGYAPLAVDFETALRAQIEAANGGFAPLQPRPPTLGSSADEGPSRIDPRHLAGVASPAGGVEVSIVPRPTVEAGRNDRNTVDLEAQVTGLAETQLRYAAVSRLISLRLGMLRDVVGGRF